jgi:hypothetical protein
MRWVLLVIAPLLGAPVRCIKHRTSNRQTVNSAVTPGMAVVEDLRLSKLVGIWRKKEGLLGDSSLIPSSVVVSLDLCVCAPAYPTTTKEVRVLLSVHP